MKVKGKPNEVIHVTHPVRMNQKNKRTTVVFDSNGEAEVFSEYVYNRLVAYLEKRGEVPVMENIPEKEEPKEDPNTYQCKKCDYVTTSKTELMAHYRNTHPKKK